MSLTNKAPHAERDENERSKHRRRWRAHHWLSSNSVRAGAKSCMHPLNGVGSIKLARSADGAIHTEGVQRCGSAWACPVCAPVVRERRGAEADLGCSAALALGYSVWFVTATVSHKLGDQLSDVVGLVTGGWSATFSGRWANEWRKRTGFVGAIRVLEVTHGGNGWHPHIHAVLIFKGRPDPAVLEGLGLQFAGNVAKRGGRCDVPGPGWDVSEVVQASDVAQYLAKVDGGWGVGLELARGDLKTGRGLQPAQLLAGAMAGDVRHAALFRIYEEVTKGRAFMQWSKGLRDRLELGSLLTEAEASVAEVRGALVYVAEIPVAEWVAIVRMGALGQLYWLARRGTHLSGSPPSEHLEAA